MAKVNLVTPLAETCGSPLLDIPAPTVGRLLVALRERFGEEAERQLRVCRVLVNGRNVASLRLSRTPLAADDEVWLLPAVAGG